jgi:hypothetical protein
MPPRVASAPAQSLYRIGRSPHPARFPPLEFQGKGRFDDPRREYRVLYAAEQRRGAFVETLASFRPDLDLIARAHRLQPTDPDYAMPTMGTVPDEYFDKQICRLRLSPGQTWLDLRSPETHQWLRTSLASSLVALGIGVKFAWGELLGDRLEITQAVSRLSYESGHQGMVFPSSHDPALDCWVVFEGASFRLVGRSGQIRRTDRDLLQVVDLFGLSVH